MLMEVEGMLQKKFEDVLKCIEAVPKEDLALVRPQDSPIFGLLQHMLHIHLRKGCPRADAITGVIEKSPRWVAQKSAESNLPHCCRFDACS